LNPKKGLKIQELSSGYGFKIDEFQSKKIILNMKYALAWVIKPGAKCI